MTKIFIYNFLTVLSLKYFLAVKTPLIAINHMRNNYFHFQGKDHTSRYLTKRVLIWTAEVTSSQILRDDPKVSGDKP